MDVIEVALGGVEVGKGKEYRDLKVFPVIPREGGWGVGDGQRGYMTLGTAIEAGLANIREVSAAGSVGELEFENRAELPVLIVDGEELVGAKQNRTANLTLLVPARKTVVIPVSCVEAGRWHTVTEELEVSERAHFGSGRAAKMATVSHSMRHAGSRRSDQARVWGDIACASDRLGASSPTRAVAAIFERHRTNVESYVRSFRADERQVGAIFAVGSRVSGLDLFDDPATLREMFPKLVRSWAVEAIGWEEPEKRPPGRKRAISFLRSIGRADTESFPAITIGTDIRVTGRGLIGGGLVHDGRLIHLAAFATATDDRNGPRRSHRGMASARVRRDRRNRRT